MKAIVIEAYGTAEVLKPATNLLIPEIGENQVLIENYAAGVNPHDIYLRAGALSAFLNGKFPIIPGLDIAGKVAAIGSEVKTFKPGDYVYAMMDANKRLSSTGFAKTGAYAEFSITREDTLSEMPKNVSFMEAASIPLVALTAYQAIVGRAEAKKGQRILINGASGGVGSMSIQLANHLGLETVAVCNTETDSFVSALKPHRIIHYDTTDFTTQGEKYDIVFDIVGNKSFDVCAPCLTTEGIYISNVPNENTFKAYQNPHLEKQYGFHSRNKYNWVVPQGKDLMEITRLINQGAVKPVVSKVFNMDDASQAHHHLETGNAKGKIVLAIKDHI